MATERVAVVGLAQDWSALLLRHGIDLGIALLLLIGGFWFGRWAQRRVLTTLGRSSRMDRTLIPFLGRLARLVVFVIVLIAVLAQLGVQTTSILALVGAAGLAVGLALKDTLANVASGLMLLSLRPFNVGDSVSIGGVSGVVLEIGLFMTRLRGPEGQILSLPNAVVAGDPITNFSSEPHRRMEFSVGVDYAADLEQTEQLILTAIHADPRLCTEPAPEVFVETLGDSAVQLRVRAWAAQADYFPARRALLARIKQSLDAGGIGIPFPQTELRLHGSLARLMAGQAAAATDPRVPVEPEAPAAR